MDNTILLKIIMPSKIVVECQADMVNIPGGDGMFGVLPLHAPLISSVNIGLVSIFIDKKEKKYFVYGGVAEVNNWGLNIITEFAVDIQDFNKAELLNIIKDLKNKLLESQGGSLDSDIIKAKVLKYESLINFI